MAEYRPVPDERVNDYLALVRYAFRPEERHEPVDSVADLPAPATLAARRGLFDGETLCCVGAHHWLTLDVRGDAHAVAGLSAVSTDPGRRRQGLVEQFLGESLAEYRERDIQFAALWPFAHAFYRQFGWALASRYARTTCPPGALAVADGDAGRFVEPDADRWRDLDRVYGAHDDCPLAMHRTEAWWRKRVFTGWEGDPYVYGWERDGALRGYLVYTVTKEGDARRLEVEELAAVDHEAYRQLLRLPRNHGSQVERVELYGPAEPRLLDVATEPSEVEVTVLPGPMLRLVDAEAALSGLSLPGTGEVVLRVRDGFVDRNDDTFRLVTGADGTACDRTDADPDVAVDVGTLAQLVVGYHSVSEARRVGDLDTDDATAETLDALFPEAEPFLREFF
jgi:predicted acetyltransferase